MIDNAVDPFAYIIFHLISIFIRAFFPAFRMSFLTFDRCPVEFIFLTFEYSSGNDILYSFFHTSSHIDNILKYYDKYSLNFTSMTRTKYHFIFSHIKLKLNYFNKSIRWRI
jgi:hypothetical protein